MSARKQPYVPTGDLPHQTEANLAAAAQNGKLSQPASKPFTASEADQRMKAVRAMRRLTLPGTLRLIRVMKEMERLVTWRPEDGFEGEAPPTNMDRISASNVLVRALAHVFDRGGLPVVSQLEVSGDSVQPMLLISGHHQKPGAVDGTATISVAPPENAETMQ